MYIFFFFCFCSLAYIIQGWRYYYMFIEKLNCIDVICAIRPEPFIKNTASVLISLCLYVLFRGGQTKHT